MKRAQSSPRRMLGGTSKPLDWAPHARAAYRETIARIAADDPTAADLVRERVDRALKNIAAYPGLGTPGHRRSERRFVVPKTGHVFHYRVSHGAIRIVLWYRARQEISR